MGWHSEPPKSAETVLERLLGTTSSCHRYGRWGPDFLLEPPMALIYWYVSRTGG